MLGRRLDDSYAAEVRHGLTTVTAARLTANAVSRYLGPFVATVAAGLDVTVGRVGVAIAVAEGCGLASPLIGNVIDRIDHRRAMLIGLGASAVAAMLLALSEQLPGSPLVGFGTALVLFTVSKIVYDVALGRWVADHVPYARRGRVIGFVEMSWALGLLIGVSLMGLITAWIDWRWAYGTAAIAIAALTVAVGIRLRPANGGAATELSPPTNTTPPEQRQFTPPEPTTGELSPPTNTTPPKQRQFTPPEPTTGELSPPTNTTPPKQRQFTPPEPTTGELSPPTNTTPPKQRQFTPPEPTTGELSPPTNTTPPKQRQFTDVSVRRHADEVSRRRLGRRAWLAVATMFLMCAASQVLFITFGAWLEDDHGFSAAMLAVVTFSLGVLELGSSSLASSRTDRWGKERSVLGGLALMAIAGAVLIALASSLAGLVLVIVFIAGFEFAIVSLLPMGGELVAGRPGTGIGLFFAATASSRAAATIPATQLFESVGFWACAVLAVVLALAAAAALQLRGTDR